MLVTTSYRVVVYGHVSPGFETVRDVFADNFVRRWVGWSLLRVSARQEGRRHLGRYPQQADWRTLGAGHPGGLHSATKGLAAMTLALAHSRGWADICTESRGAVRGRRWHRKRDRARLRCLCWWRNGTEAAPGDARLTGRTGHSASTRLLRRMYEGARHPVFARLHEVHAGLAVRQCALVRRTGVRWASRIPMPESDTGMSRARWEQHSPVTRAGYCAQRCPVRRCPLDEYTSLAPRSARL